MTRRTLPITTVRPGDLVTISLAGRAMGRTNTWAGTVIAVDSVAIRIAASWTRFTLQVNHAEGEHVIPWRTIASIRIHAAATGDPTDH